MKKIIAISTLFIFLMSHLGFTMTTHTCGGHAVESKFTIGKTILDCGMMKEAKNCSDALSKNCCSNESQSLQVNDDYSSNSTLNSTFHPVFVQAFVYTFIVPQPFILKSEVEGTAYSPPQFRQDLPVLLQTFRI